MVVLDRRAYWLNNFNWMLIGALAGYGFSTGKWWVAVAAVVAALVARVLYFMGESLVDAFVKVLRSFGPGSEDP